MSRQPEKQARAEAILGEIAELGLVVAKELASRLRGSESVEGTVALAGAFQKVSRVVRLTLALDFKLERAAAREAKTEAREAQDGAAQVKANAPRFEPPCSATNSGEARKDRVRSLMNRLLWNESEGEAEDYESLLDDLTARLDEAALSADFETIPMETLVQRVIADMGLSGDLTLSLVEPPSAAAAPTPATDSG